MRQLVWMPCLLIGCCASHAASQVQPLRMEARSTGRVGKTSPLDFGAKCDGLTDDTAALNAFFAVTASGSIHGLIPHGMQCNAKRLTIPSHLSLTLSGTLFQIAGNNTDFLTMAAGTTDVAIDGDGTINGNRANQLNKASLPGACINAFGVTDLFVGSITITQCPKFPVNVWSKGGGADPSNVTLRDTVMSYSGNSPEFVRCTDCWAYGINSSHIDDYAFSFYQGCFHCGAIGGSFDYSAGGISVLTDSASAAMSDDVRIVSTSASYNDGPGYLTWNNGGPSEKQHTNINFTSVHGDHNHLDSSHSGSQNFGGVWMQACARCSVTNSVFHHDGGQKGEVSVGVYLANFVTNPVIVENRIYDEGQGSGGLGVGISISPDTAQSVITGNRVWDDQTSKTVAYGLNGVCSIDKRCKVHDNSLGAFLGSANNILYRASTLQNGNPKNCSNECLIRKSKLSTQ